VIPNKQWQSTQGTAELSMYKTLVR